jgi:hypothetical protein
VKPTECLTVGTLDDRVLAQTGPPPLAQLPLDPLALLAEPVITSTLGAHLETLGLDPHNGRNNPAGFEAAPEFWDFFQTHRLP